MTMNEIAGEVIRSRTTHKDPIQRPSHPRAAKALRGLAQRLDPQRIDPQG